MSTYEKFWRGKGRSVKNPVVYKTAQDFYWGGRKIPAGSEVKQFETTNFGFTLWTTPEGVKGISRE